MHYTLHNARFYNYRTNMVFSALRAENAVQVPYIHDPTDPEGQHGGLGGVPPTLKKNT